MFHRKTPGESFINRQEYRDKVLGCWTGKNIGGTLGAPLEGRRELFDVTFYTQDLRGNPVPNDDLDLQLAWLRAVETNGVYHVDERILAESWLACVIGPWGEYGVARFNLANGLPPPLSGICNNEQWKNSNGAWIRSELWACLFPGEPDEAVPFAWCDACVDHAEEGIYAELFTVTLEAAAFIEHDIRKLIDISLLRIPPECRVARSVRLAVAEFEAGHDWRTARNRVVEESADLGWFQAPANIGFVIIGLLYGGGDFGRTICTAVNCGDDTDCTGATCGALLGILNGRSGIPPEWCKPIGEGIRTVAVNSFDMFLPETLDELTDRVIACKVQAESENPTLLRLTDGLTSIAPELPALLEEPAETASRVLARSSRRLEYPLPFGRFAVEFEKGPVMRPGERQKLKLSFGECLFDGRFFSVDWKLPDGWTLASGARQRMMIRRYCTFSLEVELTAGEFPDVLCHLPLELRISDRDYPILVTVPFQLAGTVQAEHPVSSPGCWDAFDRSMARGALVAEQRREAGSGA